MDDLRITYEKGVMIITHPNGRVCKYTKSDLEKFKLQLIGQAQDTTDKLIDVNKKLYNIQLSETQ